MKASPALGEQGELTQQVGEEDRLELTVDGQPMPADLPDRIRAEVDGVTNVLYTAPADRELTGRETVTRDIALGELTIFARRGRQALPDIIQLVNAAGVEIHSVRVKEPDLEAVFLALTGRALRD